MKEANYIEVAEQLYYYVNPDSRMDVPSFVYETTRIWYGEWLNTETELDFFEWCIKTKSP